MSVGKQIVVWLRTARKHTISRKGAARTEEGKTAGNLKNLSEICHAG